MIHILLILSLFNGSATADFEGWVRQLERTAELLKQSIIRIMLHQNFDL